MKKAGDEMSHYDAYDYIVVNDNVGVAYESVKAILRAEQLKRERQIGIDAFVRFSHGRGTVERLRAIPGVLRFLFAPQRPL